MSEEFKPCPFCGQPAQVILYFPGEAMVVCSNSACESSTLISQAAWNTRPGEDALRERAEKAERALLDANADAAQLAAELELEQNPGYTCNALRMHLARLREAEAKIASLEADRDAAYNYLHDIEEE